MDFDKDAKVAGFWRNCDIMVLVAHVVQLKLQILLQNLFNVYFSKMYSNFRIFKFFPLFWGCLGYIGDDILHS